MFFNRIKYQIGDKVGNIFIYMKEYSFILNIVI